MSGGQPMDKGTINGIPVLDVYEEDNEIIHVIEDNIYDDKVHLAIDWNTRFDHMQQHTGQHLISAVFAKLYNGETIGFHLGSEFVYVDITLPQLTENDIERIERFANEIIFSNFSIKTYIIGKNDVSKVPLRKQPSVESNIRIVEIDSIDYSPCGGTHHRNIGEVGIIKIRKWEKYKGNIRVEFVCGSRALKDYAWKNTYINNIANLLSSKDTDTYTGVRRVYDENKSLLKEIKDLKNELLTYKGKDLVKEHSLPFKDTHIVRKVFVNSDFKDVRYLASQILSEKNTIVLFGLAEDDKCQFLIGRSEDININMSDIFKSVIDIIGGKGGGNNQLVQGGGPKIENLDKCLDTGLSLIKELL